MPDSGALTRAYSSGRLVAEGFAISEVSEQLTNPGTLVWVDFVSPTQAQLDELVQELSLHELAVEDALGPHQRPKLDHYESHLFLACHAVEMEGADGGLHVTEIDAFINPRWLVTVRKDGRFPMTGVLQRWDRSPALSANGVAFLLYGLLDVVVDTYFDAVQAFDEYYEDVSESIFSERPLDPSNQRHWFETRQALVRFHRLVVPMREAVSSLMRREGGIVTPEIYPYFQDIYDHVLRISESSESLRDLVATIVETNLSLRDYRQNQVVKKVGSWAAIAAVPALITGFYGMNVPFPGSGETSGFVASAVLMAVASAGLYVVFRRRDWL